MIFKSVSTKIIQDWNIVFATFPTDCFDFFIIIVAINKPNKSDINPIDDTIIPRIMNFDIKPYKDNAIELNNIKSKITTTGYNVFNFIFY